MNFFTGIWLTILGFFGVASEVVVEPMLEVDSVVVQVASEEVEIVQEDTIVSEDAVTAVDPVEVDEEAVDSEVVPDDMMGGSVSPADIVQEVPTESVVQNIRTMLVAGGCFWCVEADLEKTRGVITAVSGYAGGNTTNPTYKTYGSGGHREVVEVTYDANQISFEDILIVTMKTTDPTDDDGTFADRGDKYSAAFYYETEAQKTVINDLIKEVDSKGPYLEPLAIDVESRPTFWEAEARHQDYYKGVLTQLKYNLYRNASGRNDFIKKYWGKDHSPNLPWRTANETVSTNDQTQTFAWSGYIKPDAPILKSTLDPLAYKVTQNDGTERAWSSPLDSNWERGIYVDILSGQPLYSSKDKYDSGTGWPSFVAPITADALTLHEDRGLFSVRTETRSAIADNHIGHVFNDGPADRGGLRYCMNGVALRFVPEASMTAEGYTDFIQYL